MPIIFIHTNSALEKGEIEHFLPEVVSGVSTALEISEELIHVFLCPLNPLRTISAGKVGRALVLYEVQMIKGREKHKKQALVERLYFVAKKYFPHLNVDIRTVIQELERDNMGIGGNLLR